ncbi:hypothetical protein I4U23_015751 [Adineta vaga]|nr:hypothetical protein I4U23_015751 [Adineta vaga]
MNNNNVVRRHDRQPNEVEENLEDITLIWLDSNMSDSLDYHHTQTSLENLTNCVLFYTDSELCIAYIRGVTKERIFLIVSGASSQSILPQIQSLTTITVIFIFCAHRESYVPLLSKYPKITDIFTDQQSLVEAIRKSMYFIRKQGMAFNLLNHQKQKSTRDISKDLGSFTWFQSLIDILRKLPQTDRSKQDMLGKCREYYALNQSEMRKIDQFELTYTADKAIEWYTRDSFVYRLVNKALRTEDVEILYLFRFFIIDLCSQLEDIWKQSNKKNEEVLTLYRGQRMSIEEYNKLIHNIGNLISTNGFFSTTKDINVALKFLETHSEEFKTILFEIKVPHNLQTIVFADIDLCSQIEGEKEVLFSLGSVFQIDNVIYDPTMSSCKIQMTATDEGSIIIQDHLNAKRRQIDDYSPQILFGRLLFFEFGRLDKGDKYFRKLLKTLPPNHEDFASVYNNLGIIFYGRCQLRLALEFYVRAYILRRRNLHAQHPATAASLMNIGLVYHLKGNYNKALFYLERSLKIFQNNFHDDYQMKAIAMNGLGLLYRDKNEFKTALEYLNQALAMYRRLLPLDHPNIACCLGNIGLVYEDLKDYEQALVYYCRAFEIDEKLLPCSHPNLIDDFNRIIDIYMKKNEDKCAMEFCQKTANKQEDNLLLGHILKNMGDITSNITEGIDYYEKALTIFERSLNSTDSIIIHCLIDISRLLWKSNMFTDALNYQLKALNKQENFLQKEHAEIIISLENIGRLYYNMQKWQDSINYFEKAMILLKLNININHNYIEEIENLIILAKRNENTSFNDRENMLGIIEETNLNLITHCYQPTKKKWCIM